MKRHHSACKSRSIGACVLALALHSLAVGRAAADDAKKVAPAASASSAESAEYERTVDAALEEYRTQHYEEARGLFEHAHELEPSARTLRGLGMVEFELRHYVRSASLLSAALASTTKPLTDEQRSAASALLARTKHFVAHYRLELVPADAQPKVALDGELTELAADRVLAVSAGEHRLAIVAPGYAPSELNVDATGGEERTLHVELQAIGAEQVARAAIAAAPETELATPHTKRPYRTLSIALFGAGLAELAAGATLGAIGLHQAKQATTRDGSEAEQAKHLALAGDILLGVGAASAITGVVLWFWRKGEQPPARAGLQVETVLPHVRVRF